MMGSMGRVPSWLTAGDSKGVTEAETDPLSARPERRNSEHVSFTFEAQEAKFKEVLSTSKINLSELQRLSAQGVPDGGGTRPIVWKLLLKYLPTKVADWEAELKRKRLQYEQFRKELIVNPSLLARCSEEEEDGDDAGEMQRQSVEGDHPLNSTSSSVWNKFFQDTELWEQIDRDVKRTHPDLTFFNGQDAMAVENQGALARALFIFAKLNPGIKYVQGMNEVLAPLLYVFRLDTDERHSRHAEADAFFCFVELISDFRDHFCQQLDNSAVGIRSTISRLTDLLKARDLELWRHLDEKVKVNPQFYAFRWITLLLTQEFNFADSLRLWDSLLSNPEGPLEILLRVCCAMLICVRAELLVGDFTSNLKLLQNFPPMDIHSILVEADRLREPGL